MSEGSVSVRLPCGVAGSGQAGPWLQFIHKMNELDPGDGWNQKEGVQPVVAAPDEIRPWWAGGTAEEYPDVRVIHRSDPTVSIVSKTERGAQAIRAAAEELDIHIPVY